MQAEFWHCGVFCVLAAFHCTTLIANELLRTVLDLWARLVHASYPACMQFDHNLCRVTCMMLAAALARDFWLIPAAGCSSVAVLPQQQHRQCSSAAACLANGVSGRAAVTWELVKSVSVYCHRYLWKIESCVMFCLFVSVWRLSCSSTAQIPCPSSGELAVLALQDIGSIPPV